jgi:hypothetical protein
MGRVRECIKVNGREFWTQFDTASRNTYVSQAVAALLAITHLPTPFQSELGGKTREVAQTAVLDAEVQGCRVSTHAMVLEDGKAIEVLFGALAMRQWGIRTIPDLEKLDMSHYSQEFVGF